MICDVFHNYVRLKIEYIILFFIIYTSLGHETKAMIVNYCQFHIIIFPLAEQHSNIRTITFQS